MKMTLLAGSLVALALWFGYNRGYHQGLQTERRAWESTLQRETSMVTLDNRSRHVVKQFYRNPHLGILVATFPGNTSVNVPDLRNSRCFDLVRRLTWLGHEVEVADPLASREEIERERGLTVTDPDGRRYDLVVGAVAHDQYREFDDERLAGLVAPGGTLADLKGMWRDRRLDPAIDRWTL